MKIAKTPPLRKINGNLKRHKNGRNEPPRYSVGFTKNFITFETKNKRIYIKNTSDSIWVTQYWPNPHFGKSLQ